MRPQLLLGGALFVLLAAAPAAALDPGDYFARELVHDGAVRIYDLRVPAGYDGKTPIPLVLDLHGLSSNQSQQRALSGFLALADAEGFAVAWPNGLNFSWNAGWCCGTSQQLGVHDVAFLRTLVEALARELAIDRTRVYVTGLSNGGAMTQRLACEAADVFAAAAPMAFPISLYPITSCQPSRPISVLTTQAPTDELVPYDGGNLFPSAAASFAQWRANDVCGDAPLEQEIVVGESHCDYDTSCAEGTEVGLCTVASTGLFGGHIVYLNEDFVLSEVAWDFFSRHALSAAPPPLPVLVPGRKLSLKDADDPSKRKLALELKDPALVLDPALDPTAGGAALQLFNSNGSGELACLPLPAAGWKRKGAGFVYKDARQLAGPCKSAKLAAGKLEVACDGKSGALGYSLDEAAQGSLAARFASAPQTFCAQFGGSVEKDQGVASGKAAFLAKAAPAPAVCPALPAPCPAP